MIGQSGTDTRACLSSSALGSQKTIQPDQPDDAATIGGFLRALRRGRRLTMEQSARQAGLHRATLDRWEKGRAQPRLPELKALLGALGASPQQRRRALTLVDAPRARALVRADLARTAGGAGLGPMPQGGDLLRALRLRRGRSLEQTAAHLGVTSVTVRRWEATETWPAAQQLHRLCYALGAKEEEVLALTCGRFARTAPSPLTKGTAGGATAEALAERVERFARTLHDPPFGLKDLELLTLRAEAWALAARGAAAGTGLLAEVYGLSSRYLAYRDRAGEAVAAAGRYFDLVPGEPRDGPARAAWLKLRLGTATARLHVPGRATTPRRCLEELRRVLPHARGTRYEAEALSRIAEMLRRQGARDEALRVSEEAHRAAMNDEDAASARGEHGIQLVRSGRFAEGLPLLSAGRAGDWYRLVETWLWEAEALAGLGEEAEAGRRLARAQSDLGLYEMTPLQPRLDALRARLDGEPLADG